MQIGSTGATAAVTLLQSVNVPVRQGFRSSQRVNCTTVGDMSGAGHYAMIRQKIEILNLQHLNYGTSEQKSYTSVLE